MANKVREFRVGCHSGALQSQPAFAAGDRIAGTPWVLAEDSRGGELNRESPIGIKLFRYMVLIAAALAAAVTLSCSPGAPPLQLRVYNADSLIIPFQEIEKRFEFQHPGVDVLIEGHGSIQVIRAATELGEEVDVAVVADSQLVRLLMYDTPMKEKNGNYAHWCIDFATNALGIAYTANGRYAAEISADNWYQIMSRPDVKIGLSDPRIDSLGYRALMTLRLAEDYYRDSGIIDGMLGGAFVTGLKVSELNGLTTITVPEILKPSQNRVVLRTYSLQILALLESGDVDYSFEYESVARQHGLHFLRLPGAVDLSSQEYASAYKQVRVKMDYQRFASVNPEFPGALIVYGATIPNNAKHPQEAALFIEYLLGQGGQEVLKQYFQPPLVPATCDNSAGLPDELRSRFK
jgi:molybdate/tungstate transport system substrate-binding protein